MHRERERERGRERERERGEKDTDRRKQIFGLSRTVSALGTLTVLAGTLGDRDISRRYDCCVSGRE